jgi:hypothetical protein
MIKARRLRAGLIYPKVPLLARDLNPLSQVGACPAAF